MTVQTTTNTKYHTGDGTQTTFPFDYAMQQTSDMDVYLDGVLQSSGYTVSTNSSGVGGNVIFSSAPADETEIILQRIVDYTQGLDLPTEGNLPEVAIENAFDKIVMMCQQLEEQASRSLKFALNTSYDTEFPAPEALKLLRWNADGDALENTDAVGDVLGPDSCTDNSIAMWDSTDGTALKDGPAPGDADIPLVSQGAGAAPAFAPLNLAGAGVINALPKARQYSTTAYVDDNNGWQVAQLPTAANLIDLGSTALPFRNLYLGAANVGTKFVSNASGAERTVTFPDANSNTVVPDTGAANNFLTGITSAGVITKAQPAFTDLTGNATVAQGGTNITSYTLGDILYASAGTTLTKLAGNTSATQKFLSQTGNGAASAAPAWNTIAAGDIASGTLPIARGGTNNGSLGVSALGIYIGDGSKVVQLTAGASQSWRVNSAGNAIEAYTPAVAGSAVNSLTNGGGISLSAATGDITISIASSANLPGSPTTTTQSAGDNSTKIATTAYVDGKDGMKTVSGTVSSAEIKALRASPKTLIAAPGANKTISIVRATFKYVKGATAYSGANAMVLQYNDAANTVATQNVSNVFSGAAFSGPNNLFSDDIGPFKASLSAASTTLDNCAVILKNSGGSEYTLGDGTVKYCITYQVLDAN